MIAVVDQHRLIRQPLARDFGAAPCRQIAWRSIRPQGQGHRLATGVDGRGDGTPLVAALQLPATQRSQHQRGDGQQYQCCQTA